MFVSEACAANSKAGVDHGPDGDDLFPAEWKERTQVGGYRKGA